MTIFKTLPLSLALSLFIGCGGGSTSDTEEQKSLTNTKPSAQDVVVNTNEDEAIMITLLASDSDQDSIHYTLTSPSHGTLTGQAPTLTYTPAANYNGQDNFSYHVNDGSLDSQEARVSIMIASTNVAPVVSPLNDSTKEEGAVITFTSSAVDADGDTLSYLWKEGDITLSKEQSFSKSDFNEGEHTITCTVTDTEGASDSQNVTVHILASNQQNDAPTVDAGADQTANYLAPVTLLATVNDIEGDTTSCVWQEGATVLGNGLKLVKSDFSSGAHTLTAIASDSHGASSRDTVVITIINHEPIADTKTILTKANTPVAVTLSGRDFDGNNLTFKLSYQPRHGALSGTLPALTYTPNTGFRGNDSFKYQVYDGDKYSDMSTISIQVNENPIVDAGDDENVLLGESITLSANASDNDGSIVSYQWKQGNTVLSNAASFTFTPSQMGKQKLTVEVSDDIGAKAQDTVMVSVHKIQPMVVIMIEFDDYQFNSSVATWQKKIFGTQEGELNDYYREISYGLFQFSPVKESDATPNDGMITVKLNMNHPGNDGFDFDKLVDAINLANPYIDFTQYDTNHNGALSKGELQVMFLVAGGEAATGLNPGIWAHQSCINNVQLDGVEVMGCGSDGTYARFGESHFQEGQDATIGVIAHELGHAAFGLPDLYDTTYHSEGIGDFGLMGGGSWGQKTWEEQPGTTPVHMTGWSKLYTHFTRAYQIEQNKNNVAFRGSSYSDYQVYKILTGREGEYFLLENRVNAGYDRGLFRLKEVNSFTGGLCILHIDAHVNDTGYNNNDDVTHKLVDVEEANNAGLDNKTHTGHVNNLFFAPNADSFTPTTTPNSNRYDGTSSGFSITNISDVGDTMHADIEIQ